MEGEPLGYMLENRHIRAGLAQAVSDAGIAVLAPAKVAAVEVSTRMASVQLADGRTLEAPLVVGADGRGSLVRQAAGIDTFGWSYPHTAVVATVEAERDHLGVAYEHFLPTGPFAILPLPDRRASLVWTEAPARAAALKAASAPAFEAHLARRFGPFLGAAKPEGPRFTYSLPSPCRWPGTPHRPARLMPSPVGDAWSRHPSGSSRPGPQHGSQGLGAALAEVVIEAQRLGEDIGAAAVLARYDRWRRLDNIAVAAATDAFNRLFANDHLLVRTARDIGMAAVNRLGPARRAFMAEAGGALGDLPRLLKGEAL